MESLKSVFANEKEQKETLQGEIEIAKCRLQEDMFRSKSALLMDLISMHLFYAVKELSFDEFPDSPELKTGVGSASIKTKILENSDLLLELFKGYVNIMNSKGEKMLETSESLRLLLGSEHLFEQELSLCNSEDLSLYMANKTDDDKAVASSLCHDTTCESRDEVHIPAKAEKLQENDEYSILRENLVSLKNSADARALDFLKKAFEFDSESNDLCEDDKKVVYEMIQDFAQRREAVLGECGNENSSFVTIYIVFMTRLLFKGLTIKYCKICFSICCCVQYNFTYENFHILLASTICNLPLSSCARDECDSVALDTTGKGERD